jgi:hypothetical protein
MHTQSDTTHEKWPQEHIEGTNKLNQTYLVVQFVNIAKSVPINAGHFNVRLHALSHSQYATIAFNKNAAINQ